MANSTGSSGFPKGTAPCGTPSTPVGRSESSSGSRFLIRPETSAETSSEISVETWEIEEISEISDTAEISVETWEIEETSEISAISSSSSPSPWTSE